LRFCGAGKGRLKDERAGGEFGRGSSAQLVDDRLARVEPLDELQHLQALDATRAKR